MKVESNHNINCNLALAALYDVYDPEIGLNVVDLGLIYRLDFDEKNKKIFCRMTLTTQFCPMGESITEGVKNAIQRVFPESEISLELSFDPPWNYEKISEEGQAFLNL